MIKRFLSVCTAMIFGLTLSAYANTVNNTVKVVDGQDSIKFKITWSNEAVRPELFNSEGVNVTSDDALKVTEFGNDYTVYEYKSPFMSSGDWTISYDNGNNKWVSLVDITNNTVINDDKTEETSSVAETEEEELLRAIDSDDLTYRADMSKVRFNWCFNGRDYGSSIDHFNIKVYEDENKSPRFETDTNETEFIIDYNKYISKYRVELSYVDVNGKHSEVLKKQIIPKISDIYIHINSDSLVREKDVKITYGNIPDDSKVYVIINGVEHIKNTYGNGEINIELERGNNHIQVEVRALDEKGEAYKLYETSKDITYTEMSDSVIKLDEDYDNLQTTKDELEISGECKGAVEVTINGKRVRINDGRFKYNLPLEYIGEQTIIIKAADKDGRISEKRFKVFRSNEQQINKESVVDIEESMRDVDEQVREQQIADNEKLQKFKITACVIGLLVFGISCVVGYIATNLKDSDIKNEKESNGSEEEHKNTEVTVKNRSKNKQVKKVKKKEQKEAKGIRKILKARKPIGYKGNKELGDIDSVGESDD